MISRSTEIGLSRSSNSTHTTEPLLVGTSRNCRLRCLRRPTPQEMQQTRLHHGVGFIVAWATRHGVAQGVLLEDFDDALKFGQLAMKGFNSTRSSLFRAASITKWNPTNKVDDSVVVDAEALEWQPGTQMQWAIPLEIYPVKHSR